MSTGALVTEEEDRKLISERLFLLVSIQKKVGRWRTVLGLGLGFRARLHAEEGRSVAYIFGSMRPKMKWCAWRSTVAAPPAGNLLTWASKILF